MLLRLRFLQVVFTGVLAFVSAVFMPHAMAAAQTDPLALLKKVDELYRSTQATAIMRMHIVTPNWERTMEMESWSRGMEDTFIRVLSPKKDRGVATLKLDQDMWNYFPKINKTIKVPPSMMMGSWMGSDFTNDDLVREVSLAEDYHVAMQEEGEHLLLILTPKTTTVTVWAKIEVLIQSEDLMPLEQRYYNEKGERVRTMSFDQVRDFSGKRLPARMVMTPHSKQGHKTIVEYIQLDFDAPITDDIFSLRNLQKTIR